MQIDALPTIPRYMLYQPISFQYDIQKINWPNIGFEPTIRAEKQNRLGLFPPHVTWYFSIYLN